MRNIDDSNLTILNYPNGIMCHLFISWMHPFKEHRLVLVGSKGMLVFEDSSTKKEIIFYNKKFEIKKGVPKQITDEEEIIKYDNKMPLTEQYRYFIDHLDGKLPTVANGDHALEITKIFIRATS